MGAIPRPLSGRQMKVQALHPPLATRPAGIHGQGGVACPCAFVLYGAEDFHHRRAGALLAPRANHRRRQRLGREYNGRLLARLLERARNNTDRPQIRFIEREELGTIIDEVRETSVFDDVGNPVAALLKSAKVDVLIIGRLRAVSARSTDLIVVYRAVKVANGEDIAVTAGRRMVGAIQGGRPGVALEQAIGRAVEVLSEAAPDMTELRLGGISYQATGVQTSAGPYIEEQIGIALQRAYRNVLSERGLIVKRAELTQGDIAR